MQGAPESDVEEHEYATYGCQPGMFLANSEANGVVDGKFRLKCGNGGQFPASPAWPDCQPSACDAPPEQAGFTLVSTAPVLVGGKAKYECEAAGEVTDGGRQFEVECQDDGTFETPTWPTCRAAVECADGSAPAPPGGSRLEVAPGAVAEFDAAVYTCESGYVLRDELGSAFAVQCELGGSYPAAGSVSFPTCAQPTCSFTLASGVRVLGGEVNNSMYYCLTLSIEALFIPAKFNCTPTRRRKDKVADSS